MRPSDLPRPDAPQHAAACYEALRTQITGATATTPLRGVGLGLLLQQGVAAWWQAVRSTMNTATSPSSPRSGSAAAAIPCDARDASHLRDGGPSGALLSASQHGDVVTLLAGLVLSACPTRHDPTPSTGASA